jgi:hypothetical protein
MITRNRILPAAALAVVLNLALSAQQKATARDTFWSASDLITVAPNPAAHKHVESNPHPRQRSGTETSGGALGSLPGRQQPANTQVAQLVMANGYGAAPHLVRSAEDRLGLRCSVMLRDASNEYTEVTPGTVFHSGDHIRLSLLANEAGYFYVIQQGSTGAWAPIFPPQSAPTDANKVVAGQIQVVPSGTRAFVFDQHPGDEKLYIILSRTPVGDIDRVMQNLRNGGPARHEQPTDGAEERMEAENRIPDLFVHQLASRDLTLVDEQTVNESSKKDVEGEKAIYVVSKGGGPESNSRVVLSLDLRHE